MTRRQTQLSYCKVCLNRQFNPQLGIICKLTQARADFESDCPDYNEDSIAVQNEINFNHQVNSTKVGEDFTFGLHKVGIKNGIIAGIILLGGGLTWLIWGLQQGLLFYYSFILILFGFIALIIGIINGIKRHQIKLKAQQKENQDTIDI